MQLQKICQNHFLFESVEDEVSPSSFINDKLGQRSGKLEAMYQCACYKLDIDNKVSQAGHFNNKSTQKDQEELLVSLSVFALIDSCPFN